MGTQQIPILGQMNPVPTHLKTYKTAVSCVYYYLQELDSGRKEEILK